MCPIKLVTNGRTIIVISVPTDLVENLKEFTNCLGTVSAIIIDSYVNTAYIVGDFNAQPNECFANELLSFCQEDNLLRIDMERLGITHTHT